MNFYNLILEAIYTFKHNKLRVLLTILGMIIGVGAVILMMGVGQASKSKIQQSIQNMGSRLLIILPGSQTSGGVRMGSGSVQTLTLNDYEAINQLSSIEKATPLVSGNFQLSYANNNWNTGINGVLESYFNINNWTLTAGTFFTQYMQKSYARVAVIGKTTAEKLFGSANPVGETIRINKIPFTVIGLLNSKGQNLDGRDQDDIIFIPLSTAKQQLVRSNFVGSVRLIMAQVKESFDLDDTQTEITDLLRVRHKIRENADDDFSIRNLSALAETASETAQNMSLLLGAVACISLLVGGIGIMNIMLVSVTERTKEIGLRLAIGAKQKDILAQFLIESSLICTFGGMLGVVLGMLCGWILSEIINLEVEITLFSILISFAFSVTIGIFFGFYPAQKASKLNPVDALRHD